jgi:hypothetical protein
VYPGLVYGDIQQKYKTDTKPEQKMMPTENWWFIYHDTERHQEKAPKKQISRAHSLLSIYHFKILKNRFEIFKKNKGCRYQLQLLMLEYKLHNTWVAPPNRSSGVDVQRRTRSTSSALTWAISRAFCAACIESSRNVSSPVTFAQYKN